MIKTDATIMLFSDSKQDRASAYHRGEPADIISLLVVAGVNDRAFGEMIIHAALTICDKLEEQEEHDHVEA